MLSPTTISYVLDAVAITVSVLSTRSQNKASNRLHAAIRELHESHDELHDFVKKQGL